jgi:hypothetical protein
MTAGRKMMVTNKEHPGGVMICVECSRVCSAIDIGTDIRNISWVCVNPECPSIYINNPAGAIQKAYENLSKTSSLLTLAARETEIEEVFSDDGTMMSNSISKHILDLRKSIHECQDQLWTIGRRLEK